MAFQWQEDLVELREGISMKDYLKDFQRRHNNDQRHKKNCTCNGCIHISGSLSLSRSQQRAEKEALAADYRRGIPLNPVGAAPEKVGLLPRIAPQSLGPLNLVGMDHSWEPLPTRAGRSVSALPGYLPALSKESRNEKRRCDGDAVPPGRVLGRKSAVQAHLRARSWQVAGDGASGSSGSSTRSSSLSSLSSVDVESPAELSSYLVRGVTPVEEYVPVQAPPTPQTLPASSAKPRGKGSRAKSSLRLPKDAPKSARQTASESAVQSQSRIQLLTNEETLTRAFKMLDSDDWEKKIEGLTSLRAVIQSHGETLRSKLHGTSLTLIREVTNRRSAVCMAAMATLGDMYVHLQRAMDGEVEGTARALLLKTAESNTFIRQAADLALGHMVHNCSPGRVMSALLLGGLSHRNVAVRSCNARHLETLADVLGPSRLLMGKGDLTGRFLVAVSNLAQDCGQEVRFHGRNMLKKIVADNNFQDMWEKCIPQKQKNSLIMVISKFRRDLM